ncbi:MAG: hypothetical protein A3C93_02940 [Candidatus Lloydbacteria bacterium RIFCSPHIGHO2_02_FULL_54_17]|uniref:SHS2 domain-containing protein n=1 Tax=Candidatus Lloydbacteria bacterium RIFCSPHIGHO2_02_FULL_54_17 TaxID=1798664 RepID=A0A1G2DAI7_9BACT|nr:MAG: hypothetical protein A2762_04810 [Candidatus Lloydbacteria bacterium RIFCSPHIGHO2_01_FULL_54_11]OGZ10626.1 MAG: hypothetical protein A3C93_02940 [Candidatus Lloydbacteria bacterium RIFCSPHIGHO2_02_FULL_54_17]OGZ13661.1 MAG: hypothetical protein A2948_03130 [Candidatus Lloydbacteria bacterium RIFCSPLOWO2_01_FULL_54_18]OGZ16097.1 MAG: hypothetical protein A3H76_01585 [Candidatus Lloydbacteria bacterium RIFCSPLOWO2_02_FULL_54_12]
MSLFQRKGGGGGRSVAIFDIGSGSIGGAFVSLHHDKPPEIIFTARRNIPVQAEINFQRFLESMGKTLESLAFTMQKAGGGVAVGEAYFILASPWYASQTRLVRYSQETPFTVTKKGIEKLIEKEILSFRNSKLFAHLKTDEAPPEIMESKNIQIKLNGYEVTKPYGHKASELEVAVYVSMIPANIRNLIKDSITRFWRPSTTHFSSFSLTAFDAIRSIFPDEPSFLFMDIAGEVTDISLAKDNILLESMSFPSGKNMLIRAVADGLKITPALAASELDLYAQNAGTPEHMKRVGEIVKRTTDGWRVFFKDALVRFAAEFPIPRIIFYTADDNVSQWFEATIKETKFARFAEVEEGFTVRALGNTFLNTFVHTASPDFQDPFLSIEAIFANKISSLTK